MMKKIFLPIKKMKVSLVNTIKFFFKDSFWKNNLIAWGLGIALALNIANWVLLWLFVEPVDLPIILHYNVYFGVDILGSWKEVFISPLLSIILFMINFFLGFFLYKKKEKIASYILILGNLMLQLAFLVYSISLILINY